MSESDYSEEIEKMKSKVGVIPWWIRNFPLFRKISGLALKDRFLLNPSLYEDFISSNPSPLVIGIVIHELEHIKRASNIGFLLYRVKYTLSPTFRYQEELECHKPQFNYYQKVRYDFDLKHRATILSGSLYFWPVSYEKALSDLEKIWNTAV